MKAMPSSSPTDTAPRETTATDTSADTIKSEVHIPSSLPPYESPLDLRYPLHFDHIATKDSPEYIDKHELLQAALTTAANELFENHKIYLHIFYAYSMPHYPGGVSPLFFEVDLDPTHVEMEYWKEVHAIVLQTIEKYFGQLAAQEEEGLEFLKRPVVRYTAKEDDDEGEGIGFY